MPEVHLIATKDLIYAVDFGWVFARHGCQVVGGVMRPGQKLGSIHGPEVFIDDLDIIEQWRALQDYAASTARR